MTNIRIILIILFLFDYGYSLNLISYDITPDSIINRYINFIGGVENVKSITDRTTIMAGKISNIEIKLTIYQKTPGLMKQIISTEDVERTLLYDGEKGVEVSPYGTRELSGFELQKLRMDADIHFFLHYDQYPLDLKYIGTDTIEGTPAYGLEFIFEGANQWEQWFSVETGEKLKETRIITVNQQNFEQISYFKDYREVSGLMMPHTITQHLGAQTFTFTLLSVDVNPIPPGVFRINK
jgi:zinc protease